MSLTPDASFALRQAWREVFALASVLPLEPRMSPGQPELVRKRVDALLAEERSRMGKASVSDKFINVTELAVVALMDEVARSRTDVRDEWRPIQNEERFRTDLGHEFYQRLKELRTDATTPVEVLEIFSRCLEWGFQGEYSARAPSELSGLRAALLDELRLKRQTPPAMLLTPSPSRSQLRNATIPAAWWPVVMLAVVMFVVWGAVRCTAQKGREEVKRDVATISGDIGPRLADSPSSP